MPIKCYIILSNKNIFYKGKTGEVLSLKRQEYSYVNQKIKGNNEFLFQYKKAILTLLKKRELINGAEYFKCLELIKRK